MDAVAPTPLLAGLLLLLLQLLLLCIAAPLLLLLLDEVLAHVLLLLQPLLGGLRPYPPCQIKYSKVHKSAR